MEPYQCCFSIVKQSLPGRGSSSGSGNENIVMARECVLRQKLARHFPQPSSGPVAYDGAANLTSCRKPFANICVLILTIDRLDDDKVASGDPSSGCAQKLAPNPEATDLD